MGAGSSHHPKHKFESDSETESVTTTGASTAFPKSGSKNDYPIKNFVSICAPATHNLFYDSTDSEITELQTALESKAQVNPVSAEPEFEKTTVQKANASKSSPPVSQELIKEVVKPPLAAASPYSPVSQAHRKQICTRRTCHRLKRRPSVKPHREPLRPPSPPPSVEEVMPDYQRYSREEPEKDPDVSDRKRSGDNNMKDCCRPCCPNKPVLKHVANNNSSSNNPPNGTCSNNPGAPLYPSRCGGHRHISDSYVSCRNAQIPPHSSGNKSHVPSHSKSAPIAVGAAQAQGGGHPIHENSSYQEISHGEPNHQHLPQQNRRAANSSKPPAAPPRKSKPQLPVRAYQPNNFEGHLDPDRPHIPLPPPPQHFDGHNDRERDRELDHHRHPLPGHHHQYQRHISPDSDLEQKHSNHEEMYSHNTNRNYVTKKQYNRQPQYRQPIKPYPYEEPGGSTTYSHESTCSNNCNGYESCPMHHTCKCQCMCAENEHNNYCSQQQQQQQQSDDQMSYCSDSSNSEYMNLAYQRTGDYPELMDELENTLSYRNRMRVQKTMQRFEMLSRQNKNLDKPIFEDDESIRQYSSCNHVKRCCHEQNECKCPHCENKMRRQNSYNTRSEALAKRPNYQPTPFPRNSGYVEKVARYMDPNLNDNSNGGGLGREPPNVNSRKPKMEEHSRHEMGTTVVNSNGTWQMDARKNEWVKVDPHQNGQNQYDFENSYPPLPPRPVSDQMYDRRNYNQERNGQGMCNCAKCLRRPR